jgi:hypothetical protein
VVAQVIAVVADHYDDGGGGKAEGVELVQQHAYIVVGV